MRIKTSELAGAALDWAVTKVAHTCNCITGYGEWSGGLSAHDPDNAWECDACGREVSNNEPTWQPSTNWAQGGLILTEARISRTMDHSGLWIAYWTDGYTEGDEGKKWMQCDRSELVAGLRCWVASKMGKEIEVPDEIYKAQ